MNPSIRLSRAAWAAIGLLTLGLALGSYLAISSPRHPQQPVNRQGDPPPSLGESPKTDDILTQLKPGLLRVDVESLLGPPSSVDSVQAANGRLLYRATFTRS